MIKRSDSSKLGFHPDRLNRINEMMQRYFEEGKTAGMLTLVDVTFVTQFIRRLHNFVVPAKAGILS